MVVVQNRILAEHPWVALELYKAFSRSKEMSFEKARDFGAAYLLFVDQMIGEQAETFGKDPYPQGVRANAKMLQTLTHSSFNEGLTKKLARIEDIFYATTLDT